MIIRECTENEKAAILDIFNEAIVNTTSLYDYKPRTIEMMDEWFASKRKGNFPVIGIFSDSNELLGFGTYGKFRERPAYKYTVEHSVYVKKTERGHGIGKILLGELINSAKAGNYHVMVAGIDSSNEISIRLHEKIGFKHAGTMEQVGFKFGSWLTLVFYQLILETPEHPVEG